MSSRRHFPLVLLSVLALGCAEGGANLAGLESVLSSGGVPSAALDSATVVAGLKEALRVGTDRTVSSTSRLDGFLANELIRINTPESLSTMTRALRTVGMGSQVDELEVAMNRAAEQAAGEAASVFWSGIQQMSIQDAFGILEGGDTAATDYFRRTTSGELRARFAPIVEEKMSAVGLVKLYDDLVGRYRAMPLSAFTQAPPDLREHVTDGALSGLFTVLGQEEARIRQEPAARSTELLRKVFGRQ
jgi:hypothetical protein